MHCCIECNGKSLKFDTIAKVKVTFMLEIFMSRRYVMYIYIKSVKERNKTGGHLSYKKIGLFQKSELETKHCFCQDCEHKKKILCKI